MNVATDDNPKIENRRNIAFVGHSGVGKTALSESLLFAAKATTRIGKTTEGSSHFDFEPEEIKHGTSLSTAIFDFSHKGISHTLIDTPGSSSFIADTITALHGADCAILVVGALSGLKVQGEKGWNAAGKENIARAIFINELDKERASFEQTLETIANTLEIKPVVVQLPIGEEKKFNGVIDLVSQKAYIKNDKGSFELTNIPENLRETAQDNYAKLAEDIAETDDVLLEQYLENTTLSPEEVTQGLKKGIANGSIMPVFCGSAEVLASAASLLDAIKNYLPSPLQRTPYQQISEEGELIDITPDVDAPFAGIIFKTLADPFTGQVSLVRVIRGALSSDETVFNLNSNSSERVGKLHVQLGKEHKTIECVYAGQIVSITKLKHSHTGHTLSSQSHHLKLQEFELPESCISFAIEPKSRGDEDKILSAVEKIAHEDPSVHITRDASTHETIISGMGQNHIEITLEKISRKFHVEVILHAPRVPYKETIRQQSEAQGKHKKQSGGHGQFGDCWLRIEPRLKGAGFLFNNKIFGGAIPRNYIPAVEKGVVETMAAGVVAGFPMVDIECTLYDGSYHAVDSSDIAFKIAASKGFRAAVEKANPVLLEPIMKVEIIVPDDTTGDVIGDLNARRGKVLNMEPKAHNQIITSDVPLSEMLTYAPTLRSLTADRGTFHMEFHGYDEVPAHLVQKIIEENATAQHREVS